MTKGYRNGVRIVRFPGGRIARFHKPGTKAYAKGAAKKKRMGKLLAKRFGIKKKRRNTARSNPKKKYAAQHASLMRSRGGHEEGGWYYDDVQTHSRKAFRRPGAAAAYAKRMARRYGDGVNDTVRRGIGEFETWQHGKKKHLLRATERPRYNPRRNPGKGYNGYPSWNAWNVSLWINNDEGLYRRARFYSKNYTAKRAAEGFVDEMRECGMTHTPDGAPFTVSSVKGAMQGM